MEVIMNKHSDDKRKRAEKRVEKIKGFYIHFAAVSYTHLTLPTNREV